MLHRPSYVVTLLAVALFLLPPLAALLLLVIRQLPAAAEPSPEMPAVVRRAYTARHP